MRRNEMVAVGAFLLASVGVVGGVTGYLALSGQSSTIELVARAPERGNWSPQTIEVERGKAVELMIRNADVVTHGFYLPGLGVNAGTIKPGEVKRVSFTPDSAGEFTFYCSVWCSDNHMYMRGTLIVR